ncbi:hypothetical protein BDF20DRAFT_851377 [Mycotypha africana]|uniref:uncharacterized protein n=1 Tax=Mycotypha africana TaxID=64632 RepID=UPI002300A10A|nr:uncharacterized protein BDF20DRAFT_851377 [Mycotypha africana]KAI8987645.1 hypothetical protein BDF20DRAFT_851377 [Mycotypha africana]
MSTTKSSDPRREDAIVPFHFPRRNEEEEDYSQMIATFISMGSIVFRHRFKMIPWIAAYFGLTGTLNSRKTFKAKDSLSNSGTFIALVSLFTYYFNLYLAHKKTMEGVANGEIVVV